VVQGYERGGSLRRHAQPGVAGAAALEFSVGVRSELPRWRACSAAYLFQAERRPGSHSEPCGYASKLHSVLSIWGCSTSGGVPAAFRGRVPGSNDDIPTDRGGNLSRWFSGLYAPVRKGFVLPCELHLREKHRQFYKRIIQQLRQPTSRARRI